jgi:hypothetical protein
VVLLPPVFVTQERPPLLNLVFTLTKKIGFIKKALNVSWHSIACSWLKNKNWIVEEGNISCIMRKVIFV